MQEEADREIGPAAAKRLRHEREMEVVNPDACAGGGEARDRLGEPLVHLLVDLPRLAREVHPVDDVVEERPEGLVADAAVKGLLLCLGEEDGLAVLVPGDPGRFALEVLGNGQPGPPDPDASLSGSLQRRDEPAGALLNTERPLSDRERERETVARDDEISEPRVRVLEAHAPVLPRRDRR